MKRVFELAAIFAKNTVHTRITALIPLKIFGAKFW